MKYTEVKKLTRRPMNRRTATALAALRPRGKRRDKRGYQDAPRYRLALKYLLGATKPGCLQHLRR